MLTERKTGYYKESGLWWINGFQQGFRSLFSFGFDRQGIAKKLLQAICKPLGSI